MYSSASCSECKLENIISDPESGEMVCRLCGIVVEEKMQETKGSYLLDSREQSLRR